MYWIEDIIRHYERFSKVMAELLRKIKAWDSLSTSHRSLVRKEWRLTQVLKLHTWNIHEPIKNHSTGQSPYNSKGNEKKLI